MHSYRARTRTPTKNGAKTLTQPACGGERNSAAKWKSKNERERERVRVQDTTLYWNGRVPRLQLVLKLFAPFSHHQCRLIALRMCDNYLSLRTDYEEWEPSIESKTKTKDLQLNSSSHLNAWVKRCVKKASASVALVRFLVDHRSSNDLWVATLVVVLVLRILLVLAKLSCSLSVSWNVYTFAFC